MKRIISIFVLIVLIISLIGGSVLAIDLTPTSGSLKITKREKGKGKVSGVYPPLEGVTFEIFKVDDNAKLENGTLISTTKVSKGTQRTGTNGEALFSNLELGRYYVEEKLAPANVTEKTANFLVDIPSTNTTGNGLIYNVEVEAKNETVYGGFVLTKQDKTGTALNGVTFKLQKQNGANWENYPDSANCDLDTDESGQITLTGLPAGNYRFVEISLGNNAGYILDNKTNYTFNVALGENSTTVVTPENITVTNDKPNLTKEITSVVRDTDDNNSVKDGVNSLDIGDTVKYKVEADVPTKIAELNTFKVTDTMDAGLTMQENSIEVKAGTTLTKTTDYTVSKTANTTDIIFTDAGKTKLNGKDKVEINYDAILNENANITSAGNKNSAKLTYSTVVKENYVGNTNADTTAETTPIVTTVYTGGFNIEKRAEKNDGTLLSGAEFKLADTEAHAKSGIYMKDKDGNEITLTTGAGANLGKVSYKGLSYGTYYLVEVKAPTYVEENETKNYNLLRTPTRVIVNASTYSGTPVVVVNKKGVWDTILPMTGSIATFVLTAMGSGLLILAVVIHTRKKDEK